MQILDDSTVENEHFDHLERKDGSLSDVSFYNCTFTRSSFEYTVLIDCLFEKCSFEDCNLSLVKIQGSKFIDTIFIRSKLLGINWSSLSGVFSASFQDCSLSSNVFVDMNLNKYKFSECILTEASFINTKLRYTIFENCDLNNCQFNNTDLSHASFETSRNYFINPSTNTLRKTIFSLPEAVSLLGNFDIILK
jgi:fluoroquinolone resistance protein